MNYLTDITVYVKTFIKSWRFGSILVDPEMKIFNLILAPLIFHQSHFKCKVVSLSISKVPSALVLITELIPKDFKEQGHLPMCHLFNMDDMYGNTSLAWQKDILTLWFCVSLMQVDSFHSSLILICFTLWDVLNKWIFNYSCSISVEDNSLDLHRGVIRSMDSMGFQVEIYYFSETVVLVRHCNDFLLIRNIKPEFLGTYQSISTTSKPVRHVWLRSWFIN